MAELMRRIEMDDPAFTAIASALLEMKDAGIEITESVVDQAIKVGQHRWARQRKLPQQVKVTVPSEKVQGGIVYYIQRGPLVKIGTTVDPRGRFRDLLPDAIHAFEPGGRALERERHRQFSHIRVGGEHFRPDRELMEHIACLVAKHGEPDPRWPTTSNIRPHCGAATNLPDPRSAELVTLTEGADRTGMKRNTVQVWGHRGRLRPVGKNAKGRDLFFLDDIQYLADWYRLHRSSAA